MPPGWKQFDLEFRTPIDNIVSLFTLKIEMFLDVHGEENFCPLSFWSLCGMVLDTCSVCIECLGTKGI